MLVKKKRTGWENKDKKFSASTPRRIYRESGSRATAPLILNLSAGWMWVVNVTPRQLCPRETNPETRWIWDCGHHNPVVTILEKTRGENIFPLQGFELRTVLPVDRRYNEGFIIRNRIKYKQYRHIYYQHWRTYCRQPQQSCISFFNICYMFRPCRQSSGI